MEFNYALYDALVSINVPSEKARTVVEAMERDMGTTLATKTDVQLLEEKLLRFDQKMEAGFKSVAKDMEVLRSSMLVQMGSVQVVTIGLLFAALKLT